MISSTKKSNKSSRGDHGNNVEFFSYFKFGFGLKATAHLLHTEEPQSHSCRSGHLAPSVTVWSEPPHPLACQQAKENITNIISQAQHDRATLNAMGQHDQLFLPSVIRDLSLQATET